MYGVSTDIVLSIAYEKTCSSGQFSRHKDFMLIEQNFISIEVKSHITHHLAHRIEIPKF